MATPTFALDLSAEQEAIRELAGSLAREVLRPAAEQAEEQRGLPPAVASAFGGSGLCASVPEAYGGQGTIDALTGVLVAEALGHGDPGTALGLLAPGLAATFIDLCGDEQQRARWLPAFAAEGAIGHGRVLLYEGFGRPATQPRTTARGTVDGWVLDGRKDAVVNPSGAGLSVVVADGEEGELGAFVFEGAPAGLSIDRDDASSGKLGLDAAPTAAFSLRDAALPAHARLAAGGGDAVLRAIARFRLTVAAIAVGTAAASFDYASGYANERIAFGKPISSFQAIAFMLVDMRMDIDVARLAVWEAACAAEDEGTTVDSLGRLTDRAVSGALDVAVRSTRDGIQVLGGHGYLADHPLERWYRAASTLSCMDFDLALVSV
jgi:acyl-CoA dehydrogenase